MHVNSFLNASKHDSKQQILSIDFFLILFDTCVNLLLQVAFYWDTLYFTMPWLTATLRDARLLALHN